MNKFEIASSASHGFQTIVNFIYRSGDSPIRSAARLEVDRVIPLVLFVSWLVVGNRDIPHGTSDQGRLLMSASQAVYGIHSHSIENTNLTDIYVSHYMHLGKRIETTECIYTTITESDLKRIILKKFAV